MKFKHLSQILILVLFSRFAQADTQGIEAQALLQQLETQQAGVIVDVRSTKEFAQGHIPGALNIPYNDLAHNRQLTAYKEQPIIIYCRSGRRAQIARQLLQEQGFKQLLLLNGHLLTWQQLHYPLTRF